MSEIARLWVTIGAKSDQLDKDLQGVQQRLNNFGNSMLRTGGIMTAAVTVPIVAGFGKIIKEAGEAQELYSKFNTVFGEYAGEVRGWADEHAAIWGRSSQDLQGYLANTQNLLVGFGAMRGEAALLSKDMVTLATDLASFNNIADSDAMGALQSALLGNHEAAKALDVIINENTLSMAMADLGYQGNFQSLSELEKIQVRYHAVVMQSTDAMGDAERTSQSYTNRVKALKGMMKDLSAEIGQQFLPIITDVVNGIGGLLEKFRDMSPETQKIIVAVLAIVAAAGPVLIIIGLIAKGIAILIGVFGFLLSPIGLIIVAIAALVALFIYLWNTNEDFRNAVIAIWEGIKEAALRIWGALQAFWEEHGESIKTIFQAAWDQVANILETVFAVIGGIFDFWIAIFTGDWQGAWDALVGIANTMIGFIRGSLENFATVLGVIWDNIKTKAATAWEGMKTEASAAWESYKTSMKSTWDGIANYFGGVWDNIRSIGDGKVGQIVDSVAAFFGKMVGFVKSNLDAIKSFFGSIWSAIKSLFQGDLQGMQTHLKTAFSGMLAHIKGMGKSMVAAGKALIQGLIDGAKQMARRLIDAVKGVVDGAIAAAKRLLGIKSPSTVFEGMGVNIGKGFIDGIENMKSLVADSMQNMVSPQLAIAGSGAVSSRSESSMTIMHNVNLQNVPATVDGASLERTLVEMLNAPQVKRKIDRVNYENQIGAVRGLGA